MASSYTIIQQGDTVQYNKYDCVCDALEDKDNLPTDWLPGSVCIVLEDSSVWMLGNDRVWHEL